MVAILQAIMEHPLEDVIGIALFAAIWWAECWRDKLTEQEIRETVERMWKEGKGPPGLIRPPKN